MSILPRPEHADAGLAQAPSDAAAATAKVATVWTGVAVGNMQFSFSDLAAILAAVYSALLIVDFLWKKWKAWRSRG